MSNRIAGIYIPARIGSTRLPRKMLLPVDGVPLIVRTCQQVAKLDMPIKVATDSLEIASEVRSAGFAAITTGAAENGTERVAYVVTSKPDCLDDDWVVIVQGDEPHIPVVWLKTFLADLSRIPSDVGGATVATTLDDDDRSNLSVVKVETNINHEAVWFSRIDPLSLRHVGVYAYRRRWLLRYIQEPASHAERSMRLEQIRSLKIGCRMWVSGWSGPFPHGIDTLQDYQDYQQVIRGQ